MIIIQCTASYNSNKAQLLKEGNSNKLFICYGSGVGRACETEKLHDEDIAILDLRFVKPLDTQMLTTLASKYDEWYVFSDSQKQGGVGSAILEFLNDANLNIKIISFEYDDVFIDHGDTNDVEFSLGLHPSQLVKKVK